MSGVMEEGELVEGATVEERVKANRLDWRYRESDSPL